MLLLFFCQMMPINPTPSPAPLFSIGIRCTQTRNMQTQHHYYPILASLSTQQASSMGSRCPGLSQGVGLRVGQPLPCQDCYYRGSSVTIISISIGRKTGNLRQAEANGESKRTKNLDPISCINIIEPAVALFTK